MDEALNLIQQGTEDWHAFRREGLGSSDAPVVMGISPWKTRLQLWEEKVKPPKVSDVKNWAMQRGHDLEPVARAEYELLYNLDMPATLAVHPQYTFLRASLDGYNHDKKMILEIKCPGKEDHEYALETHKVPEKYWPQVQHQLLVSRAELCHYFSYDGIRAALIEVKPDPDYIGRLFKEEKDFWDLVLNRTPPEPTDRDYVDELDPVNLANIEEWKRKKLQVDVLEQDLKELRDYICMRLKHPRVRGLGVRITETRRKGTVDYSRVPQLDGVDLEKYRKISAEPYFTFRLEKE